MTNKLSHPLGESVFRWSYFYNDTDFVPWDSEYPDAKTAEERHNFEDGQYAFDINRHVRKLLFGIYAAEDEAGTLVFTADKWNKDRDDLVGCATLLDWEAAQQFDGKEFSEENVLKMLQEEIVGLTEWFAQKTQPEARMKELLEKLKNSPAITNNVEVLDLYYIWRTLFSLQSEISSGAEVYASISLIRETLNNLLTILEDKLTNETNDSPEEFVIDHIEHAHHS